MGRYQPQRVNPELKQYFIIDDFSGGINTTDTDERMYDNEFRRLTNVDLSEAGSLKRRKGWGAYDNLNKILEDAKISIPVDNIFLFTLATDTYINIDRLFDAVPAKFNYTFLIGTKETALDGQDHIKFYFLSLSDDVNNCFIDQVTNGDYTSFLSDKKTIELKQSIGSINSIKYLDRIYFLLNDISEDMSGIAVYDISENKIFYADTFSDGEATSADYFIQFLSDTDGNLEIKDSNSNAVISLNYLRVFETNIENGAPKETLMDKEDISLYDFSDSSFFIPYKPTAAEVTNSFLGYNAIAKSPLEYFSTQYELKGIRGFYLTEYGQSDRVLTGIPKGINKFRINIILTGEWSKAEFETVFDRTNSAENITTQPFLEYTNYDVENNSTFYLPIAARYTGVTSNENFFKDSAADTSYGQGIVSYDIEILGDAINNLDEVRINLTSFVSTMDSVNNEPFETYTSFIDTYGWYSHGDINNYFLLAGNGSNNTLGNNLIFYKKIGYEQNPVSTSVVYLDYPQYTAGDDYSNGSYAVYNSTLYVATAQINDAPETLDTTKWNVVNMSVFSDGYYYVPKIVWNGYDGFKNIIRKYDNGGVPAYEYFPLIKKEVISGETKSDFLNYVWDKYNATYLDGSYLIPLVYSDTNKNYYSVSVLSEYENYSYYNLSLESTGVLNAHYLEDNDASYSFKAEKSVITLSRRAKRVDTLFKSEYADSLGMSRVEDFLILYAGNTMMWSSRGNFTYFPSLNYKIFPLESDDDITSIQFFRGSHLVFTKRNIWRISGDLEDINTLTFTLLNDSIGCISPKSVHSFENTVVFLSPDGLYRVKQAYFQGGLENVEKIDVQLKNFVTIDRLSEAFLYNEQYLLMYPDNEEYDTLKYYYSIATRYGHPFTTDKYPAEHKPKVVSKIGNNLLAIKAGRFYVYNNGYYDFLPKYITDATTEEKNDAVYDMEILTGSLMFGYATHDKKFKALYINAVSMSGDPLSVVTYFNGVTSSEYEKYTTIVETDGSLSYNDTGFDPNLIGRGQTLAAKGEEDIDPSNATVGDEFKLGFTVLGDETPLLHKIAMSGKAKSVSLYVKQSSPYQFTFRGISYLFKLGKVKEAR